MGAAVYNILKDERTRAMYHRVLDEGLPEWRMPAFYDRQVQVVRHIGLIEGIITLFILATFIQYGMGWAQFLEQKFLAPKKEKRVKKNKKAEVKEANKEEDDELASLRPSVYDTLPFQLYELMKQSPELIEYCKELWEERKLRKEQEAKEAKEEERGSQERAVDSNVEHHDIEQRTGLYSAVHYIIVQYIVQYTTVL